MGGKSGREDIRKDDEEKEAIHRSVVLSGGRVPDTKEV